MATTAATTTVNSNVFAGFSDETDTIITGTGLRRLNKTSEKQTFDRIPVVDLSNARSPSLEARKQLAQEIIETCENVGFFYVKHHGLDGELIAQAQRDCRRFFAHQSHEEKMELSMARNPTAYYGYAPLRRTMPDGAIKTRMYETMHWGYDRSLDPRIQNGEPADYNFWPSEGKMPGFKHVMAEYYRSIFTLATTLLRLLALGLDLEEDFFDQYSNDPQVLLALNYYPAAAAENPEGSGMYAHADLEVITLLLQDQVNSLEVLNENGDWISADPIPGTFVVNVGDTLSMWTNNRLKSTVHRAYNTRGETRCSIPFFFGVNPDVVVETLPSCVGPGNPSKFGPIRIGDFHQSTIQKVYPEGKVVAAS